MPSSEIILNRLKAKRGWIVHRGFAKDSWSAEKELEFWESEIQTAKEQIEKVDKDIFSKIE